MQAKGIKLALMSVEKCPSIAAHLKIDSVPCLMTFVGGKVVDKSPGGMPSLDFASQYVAKMVDLGASTSANNAMIQAGQLLGEGKVEEALQMYMEVLKMSKVKHGAVAHVRLPPRPFLPRVFSFGHHHELEISKPGTFLEAAHALNSVAV